MSRQNDMGELVDWFASQCDETMAIIDRAGVPPGGVPCDMTEESLNAIRHAREMALAGLPNPGDGIGED